jgi:hypothetical protein
MRKCSRFLCTTTEREKVTYTHTHTNNKHCDDDWFDGFIGDSQSDQTGREEVEAQERRHLLQLNLNCFPRTLENTDYVVHSFTWFISKKVQILSPEERRDPLHFLYEYKITDTRLTPEELQIRFFVFSLTHRDILSRTSGNSSPSRMGVRVSDLYSLWWSKTILGTIKVLFSIKALFRRHQSLIVDTESPHESRVYSVSVVSPHY